MSLEKKLEEDLKTAMKAKDSERLGVLRMVKTALTNLKIQKKTEVLADDEILDVIQKQAKQRKESMESFEKAGRTDLVAKEKSEFDILNQYLPEQLSEPQIREIVAAAIAATGAAGKADMGKVMKEIMPKVKGKADGKVVNAVVQSLL